MDTFLQSVPIFNTPRRFYASLYSAKFFVIIGLTVSFSVILSGKTRCFGVLAAQLQNQTCNSVQDTCGMATLNWIAFLSEMIVVGGNPFITNMLIRVHSGVLGGRITYQFTMVLVLGIMLTGFVVDPESLFVTDTIIQGFSTSVLLSLVTFKLSQTFPEENPHHFTALLIIEILPWFGVVLCPIFGLLITTYGWQSCYFLIALLILIVCLLAGITEPKQSVFTTEKDIEGSDDSEEEEEEEEGSENALNKKRSTSDYWEIEDDRDVDYQHPRLLQLLLNANIAKIVSRSEVIVWFVERALAMVAEYNLVVNLVYYMTTILKESILHGSLVLVTLAFGNIMGYLTVFTLGKKVRTSLIKIYMLASVFLVISFIMWQIYGSGSKLQQFTVADVHFIVIIIGLFSAISTAQSSYVAQDIIERPKIIAVSLTKLAQAVGLLLGPITSGMLIQINYFHSFFVMQAFIHALRIMLLAFISFKRSSSVPISSNL